VESCPIEIGGDWYVSNEMLVCQDLGLQEVELGLRERADLLREGLILAHCPAFQDVVIEGLKLIAVGQIVPQYLFAALR
jgi:hypothetical protein